MTRWVTYCAGPDASTLAVMKTSRLPCIALSKASLNSSKVRTVWTSRMPAAGRCRSSRSLSAWRWETRLSKTSFRYQKPHGPEILGRIPGNGGESAQVHQDGAVPVKDDDPLVRQTKSKAKSQEKKPAPWSVEGKRNFPGAQAIEVQQRWRP